MLLLYYFIQTVILASNSALVVCAEDLARCQKSGCRTQSESVVKPAVKPVARATKINGAQQRLGNLATADASTGAGTPNHRLQFILTEVTLGLLWLWLVRKGLQSTKARIKLFFERAYESSQQWIARMRSRESRRSQKGVRRPSFASLGSLADIIASGDEDTKADDSSYSDDYSASTYASSNISRSTKSFPRDDNCSIPSVSTSYTSYYSDSDTNTSRSTKSYPKDDDGSIQSSSSLMSKGAVASSGSPTAAVPPQKKKYPAKSRLDTSYESVANDFHNTGFPSYGPIISKFIAGVSKKNIKPNNKPPSSGHRDGRHGSSDGNHLKNAFDRPRITMTVGKVANPRTGPHSNSDSEKLIIYCSSPA